MTIVFIVDSRDVAKEKKLQTVISHRKESSKLKVASDW